MNKIVNIVVNTFENDARVYRTAQVGKVYSDKVVVLALCEGHLEEVEEQDGVVIHRIKLSSRKLPKSRFFQAIKFIEFNIKAILFLRRNKFTLIHAHDLTALPAAYFGSLYRKCKLVYDSHELFSSRATNVPFIKFGLKVEKFLAIKCDSVITVSESIADVLKDQFNLKKRPLVIRNIPDYIPPISKGEGKLRNYLNVSGDKFILLYQGGVFLDRGIELLIQAVDKINNDNIYLVILGNGTLKENLLASSGVKDRGNIVFLDAVPHKELHYWTSDANVGVSPIVGRSLSYRYCLPNKLFEYIRAGLPVIVSDLPDMKCLVEENNVGLIFEENNVEDLIVKIQQLYKDSSLLNKFSNNSREVAKSLNWGVEKNKLISEYEKVLM